MSDQITAEGLLSEAYQARQTPLKTPNYKIADLEELHAYQRRKREEYESALQRNRHNTGQWLRYAQFEVDQHDFARARSVYERALEAESGNVRIWIRYIETEVKYKNINHARNLLDRATTLLPRVDKLWYEYVSIEETLGNVVAARATFEKWLQWKPGAEVWTHYIEFEERYKEYDSCRAIFEKYVVAYAGSAAWLAWADFEKRRGDRINVHNVYKLGVNALHKSGDLDADFLAGWIAWEVSQDNTEAVKKLYSFGSRALKGEEARKLQNVYAKFEKRYGSTADINESVLSGRRLKYEKRLEDDPADYETWWLYLDLVADKESESELRQKFENSVRTLPHKKAKSAWLPYVYLWLRYCTWEELGGRVGNTRQVFKRLLNTIPHKSFTFSKVWIGYAEFEIRNSDLPAARKALGQSIGMCPNRQVLSFYIELEIKLREFGRARKIFDKLVENFSGDYEAWIAYVRFEERQGERERALAITDLAQEYLEDEVKQRFQKLAGVARQSLKSRFEE